MVKDIIEQLLRNTKRKGIEKLLKYLDKSGFYTAPASTKFHGSAEGALALHSLNVYYTALEIATALCGERWVQDNESSLIICALLHDLGKAGQFGKPLYVANFLKKGRSEAQPFKTNDELLTLDHEIVSVIEASKYIELTEEEQHAIAFHNGLYSTIGRYELAGKETPLQMIIHFSDLWASRILENKKGNVEGGET